MRKPKLEEGKYPVWYYRTGKCWKAGFSSEIYAFNHSVPYSHAFTKSLLCQALQVATFEVPKGG